MGDFFKNLPFIFLEKMEFTKMSQDASPQFDYEIHITVKTSDVEKFKMICSNIGVKAIVVELSEDGQHSDVMTSSTIKDDEKMLNVHSEIERICNAFTDNSLSPIRSKVETVPWHPQAPSSANKLLFKAGQHFECHFAFRVNSLRELEMLTVLQRERVCTLVEISSRKMKMDQALGC
jgi:hypothetical protein